MDEAQTRQKIIDRKLARAGWNVNDPSQVSQEFDLYIGVGDRVVTSKHTGHQYVDYLLLGQDGKPLAVVEAKRTSKDPRLGKEQALQYAQNVQKIHGGTLPLVFYTNGYDTHLWDSDNYPPFKVHGFPTRAELQRLHFLARERRALSVELIDTKISGRDYQIAALRAIMEGVEAQRRKFLMVLATGTGKTRTCVSLADVLSRARWAERVLFLVDRVALQEQALDAFKEHLPNAPRYPKEGEKKFSADRRVYVMTYPTMLNLIEDESNYISPFFFDLVVADESHRSIYNVYKSVLDYFYALKLGLTATPTNHIDHDTFDLFDCEDGDPTFAYTYEEAISHVPPYLCDYEVLKVQSKFQVEGIHGEKLSPAEQRKIISEGKDLSEINFEGTDLERKVTNSGTNRLIVKEFMEESIKDFTGTLPGKSIIFAISIGHARRLEEIFDKLYPEHKGKLARVIANDDPRVYGKGGLLDQFKNQDFPRVAISVDMLDTGIDVREIVNLVFAKPVYSYTKFWQMIGRGTRILEDDPAKRKPWCTEKDKFLIIDCWNNFEFFKMEPKGREPGTQVPLPVRLFRARVEKLEKAMSLRLTDIVEKTKGDLRRDLAALPKNNVVVMDNQALLAKAGDATFWERLRADDLKFLKKEIAPILRARTGSDFKAMSLELAAVELSTAVMTKNKEAVETLKEDITNRVRDLPLAVNVVAKEQNLIDDVLRAHWWADLGEGKTDSLIERLAPLMKYREKHSGAMTKLDVADLIAVKETVEFGPKHERLTTSAYREKLEGHIRELLGSNPVLQKIQRGEPVEEQEVMALARQLREQDPYVTEDILRKIYDHKSARFIQFMRHILGLEKLESWSATVSQAFDDFIREHNDFTSLQIRFLQTLKTFILQTGKVEKQDLIDAPFTQLHPSGIRGVFKPAQIDEILEFAGKFAA